MIPVPPSPPRYQRYPIAKQAAAISGPIGLTTSGVPIYSNTEFDEATDYPSFDTCGGAPDADGQVSKRGDYLTLWHSGTEILIIFTL